MEGMTLGLGFWGPGFRGVGLRAQDFGVYRAHEMKGLGLKRGFCSVAVAEWLFVDGFGAQHTFGVSA